MSGMPLLSYAIWVPIFAGLLAFLMAGANALVLWPGLAKRVEHGQRK